MPFEVLNSPDRLEEEIRDAVRGALPDAEIEVRPGAGPGHVEIRVRSAAFADQPLVRQQQRVYGAIAHLMRGDDAPLHAVDHLHTETP